MIEPWEFPYKKVTIVNTLICICAYSAGSRMFRIVFSDD